MPGEDFLVGRWRLPLHLVRLGLDPLACGPLALPLSGERALIASDRVLAHLTFTRLDKPVIQPRSAPTQLVYCVQMPGDVALCLVWVVVLGGPLGDPLNRHPQVRRLLTPGPENRHG